MARFFKTRRKKRFHIQKTLKKNLRAPSCRNINEQHLLFPYPGHTRRLLLKEASAVKSTQQTQTQAAVVTSGYAIDISLPLFILFFFFQLRVSEAQRTQAYMLECSYCDHPLLTMIFQPTDGHKLISQAAQCRYDQKSKNISW